MTISKSAILCQQQIQKKSSIYQKIKKIFLEEEFFDSERLESLVPGERRADSGRGGVQAVEVGHVVEGRYLYFHVLFAFLRRFQQVVDENRGD